MQGPLKLEEVLLASYQDQVTMDTRLAVVDASVSDYVLRPNTDILKMIAMPFHEHVTAHNQRSTVTWSLRQIEEFVGPAAVRHTSTVNSEFLDTVPRNSASRVMRMNSHGLPDAFDANVMWPGAHLEHSNHQHMRQRPNSCSQLPPMSVLQHQQARHHGGFPNGMSNNRAIDDMYLPAGAHVPQSHGSKFASRARADPRAPVVYGMDRWQGREFNIDEATRQRVKHNMIEMIKISEIPPMEKKLPPALANPPIPPQNMHAEHARRQMPSLTMPIPEHSSHHMQQMSIPSLGMSAHHSSSRPISAPNSFNNDLLSFSCAQTRSRPNSRPASYSQVPQEFNIHAADFTPESGTMLSAPDMHSNMESRHVHAEMDRIASSFSGQLNMDGSLSAHGAMSQGMFTHSDAAPMRQTDPGSMHGHAMLHTDNPAAVASAAAAVLNPEQV